MGDMETCLGLLFKNKGKSVLTEKEFVFTASMDAAMVLTQGGPGIARTWDRSAGS